MAPRWIQIGTGKVIPGWDKGLVGQTVGSGTLLVAPPANGTHGDVQSHAGQREGDDHQGRHPGRGAKLTKSNMIVMAYALSGRQECFDGSQTVAEMRLD